MGKSIRKFAAVTRVGIDLAKRVFFQVHAVDARGEIVVARRLTRSRLVAFLRASAVRGAMEACSSAHHWARQLLALGFEVRLIPLAHMKLLMFDATKTTPPTRRRFARRRGGRASGSCRCVRSATRAS